MLANVPVVFNPTKPAPKPAQGFAEAAATVDNRADRSGVKLSLVFKKSKNQFAFNLANVIEFNYVESTQDLLYSGWFRVIDEGSIISRAVQLVGQEELEIEFSLLRDPDNSIKVNCVVSDIAKVDRQGNHTTYHISFVHRAALNVTRASNDSYKGPVSTIVHDVGRSIGITEEYFNKKTANSGQYNNPGLKVEDFLYYLRDISLSTTDRACYLLWTTSKGFHFKPVDALNAGRVDMAKRQYHDQATQERSDGISNFIRAAAYYPVNKKLEYVGLDRRQGFGYDYSAPQKMREFGAEWVLDDELSTKTFVGKYVMVTKDTPSVPARTEYTGFRNGADLKGYVYNRGERLLESMSTAVIQVDGDPSLEPGEAIYLNLRKTDYDQDGVEDNWLGGKWIIREVRHLILPKTGNYSCWLTLHRNALDFVSTENLTKVAGKVSNK